MLVALTDSLQDKSINLQRVEERKKEQLRLKKEQKMNQLKSKREGALKKLQVEHKVSLQSEAEYSCIVCHKGEDHHPLFYLSHVKYSTVLSKTVLKIDRGFLLFSTCGHLIHEPCLLESLEKDKNYGTNYSCFLCKKVSNLRFPFQS